MVEENPIAHSLRLLWEGLPEPRKGPRPTLTLDRIVTAAVGVADAEGIAALSMRRLAAELGVGTMSLYRYVPGKDELLNLVFDHVSAPGDEHPWGGGSWRETLEISAWGQRALYQAHPWLLQVNGARPVMGPSAVSALEWMMRGLVDLPFGDREKMMVVTEVDSYVTGAVRLSGESASRYCGPCSCRGWSGPWSPGTSPPWPRWVRTPSTARGRRASRSGSGSSSTASSARWSAAPRDLPGLLRG